MRIPFHLGLSQWLELTLAFGGFIWIGSRSIRFLEPDPDGSLVPIYTVEYIALAGAVLVALLLQFPSQAPHLPLLWFSIGMATIITALGVMYLGAAFALALAPGWTAGILATVRTQGNWGCLLWWFWAGVIAQVLLMVVLTFGALMTVRLGAAFEL